MSRGHGWLGLALAAALATGCSAPDPTGSRIPPSSQPTGIEDADPIHPDHPDSEQPDRTDVPDQDVALEPVTEAEQPASSPDAPAATAGTVEQAVLAVGTGRAESASPGDRAAAESAVARVLDESAALAPPPTEEAPTDETAAPLQEASAEAPPGTTGFYASQLVATAREFASLGWSRGGEVTLDEVEVFDTGDGMLALQACVDSSQVVILDADGNTVPQPTPRTRQIFILAPASEGYAVAAQTFPEEITC